MRGMDAAARSLEALRREQLARLRLDEHRGIARAKQAAALLAEVGLALRYGPTASLPLASMYHAVARQVPPEPERDAQRRATTLTKWNLLVDPDNGALASIIDWGDAGHGDPAFDFASMPLFAIPTMLAGYREAAGDVDDGFLARTLWGGMMLALWEIRELDASAFDRSWWRMPPRGWSAMAEIVGRLAPELAP